MNYPAPLYDTEDEYRTAAMLLGMSYDSRDHTFDALKQTSDVDCYCPDTMVIVFNTTTGGGPWVELMELRRHHVSNGLLGPRNNLKR